MIGRVEADRLVSQSPDGSILPVVCNPCDDNSPDPHAAEPELVRPCRRCGTSCYVKRAFIEQRHAVVCWWCFRAVGGRKLMFHPEMLLEIERAGRAAEAWETVGEMREWLTEPDSQAAHAAPFTRWWSGRQERTEPT